MGPLLVLAIILTSTATTNAAVGKVTEQTGPTEIKRDKQVVPSEAQVPVEMNDTITTANGRAGITFVDDTKVQITEHSKLVIDNFIYDPNKNTGKLAVKIALGTVKYASGQIAKNDPQQVKIETPTATIGVRGTDFSTSVDEIGRSTIILLPSCPAGWKDIATDCKTGKIEVMTDAGSILLTKPFEATVVESRINRPARSAILDLDQQQINNLIIVSPPKKVAEQSETTTKAFNFLDEDLLSKDLLAYDELEKDFLKQFSKLDRNLLDTDFLLNLLDVSSSQLLSNELEEYNSLLPKYNPASGIKYAVDGDNVIIWRESVNGIAEITVPITASLTINIVQDGVTVKQIVNSVGTSVVTLRQSN